MVGAGMASLLTLQAEPFSWVYPQTLEDDVEQAMHFDADGRLAFIQIQGSTAEAYDALPKDMAFQVLDSDRSEVFASSPGQALEVLRRSPAHAVLHVTRETEGTIPLQLLTTPIERKGRFYLIRTARSERLVSGIRSSEIRIVYAVAFVTTITAVLVLSGVVLWANQRISRRPKP